MSRTALSRLLKFAEPAIYGVKTKLKVLIYTSTKSSAGKLASNYLKANF